MKTPDVGGFVRIGEVLELPRQQEIALAEGCRREMQRIAELRAPFHASSANRKA